MKRSFTLVSPVLFVSLAFALAAAAVPQSRAAEPPTIELGLAADGVFGLGGQYLLNKGLDRKHGFIAKARWAPVPEVERLVAMGTIPMGLATAESAVRANLRGIPLRLIQPYMTPHNAIVVRKDSPYKSLADLKGKPFAVPPEVTSAYNQFDYMMKKQGINIEKYFQLKKLGGSGIVAVLERGEVEAGYSWEAFVSRLLATGNYRVLVVPRDEMNKLLDAKVKMLGWVGALESWVSANQSMIPKVRGAWQDAIKGVQEDEEHFRKYAKRLFGLEKPGELELGWKRTRQFLLPPDFPWPDKANLAIEKRYLREATELGIFEKKAAGVIDTLFVP